MKQLILTMYLLTSINIIAQTEIGIEDATEFGQEGYYYKDLNNVFNTFEGTYLYTNGNTSFKIILEKMEMSSMNDYYYEDLVIGCYRYVENGVEKVNTLDDLDNNYTNGVKYVIDGNNVMVGNELGETEALPDEKWLILSIKDPVSGSYDRLFVKKTMTTSFQEAIKISIHHSIGGRHIDDPLPPPISYPLGQDMILVKQ